MSWTRLTSITANNGSNIITVNSGSTTNIKVGDALLVEGFDLVEIEGVFASQLQTKATWKAPTQSNVSAAVVPTFGDFNNAVEEIRKLRQVTTDNLDAMEKWWTQSNGTVTFQSYNGDTFEVRTAQEMDSSVKQIEEAGLESIAEMESQAQAIMTDVTSFSYARTEADVEAEREAARQVFAGSGMIHAGKHSSSTSYHGVVNEGLTARWFEAADANRFYLGRGANRTSIAGTSEVDHAVFNLNGITVAIKNQVVTTGNTYFAYDFKLPPSPRGTAVYNSATGNFIDFSTEVDPKYGNIASNANGNEAKSRAFEGFLANGDFRLGDQYWTKTHAANITITTDGAQISNPYGNTTIVGITTGAQQMVSGAIYKYVLHVEDVGGVISIYNGTEWEAVSEINQSGLLKGEFTATGPAAFRVGVNRPGYATSCKIKSVSVMPSTQDVVTHPVDVVGLEWFLRPITESDPILYPNCLQQCKYTSVDGIPTVENVFRPLSHFEVFPGDTKSRGRGFNIFDGSLTEQQLKQQFQKKSNRVVRMSDGTIAQWTLSQRTIRGLGNGDWDYINAAGTDTMSYDYANSKFMLARGNQDGTPEWFDAQNPTSEMSVYYPSNSAAYPNFHMDDVGVFKAGRTGAPSPYVGINGECYFYLVATVPRLNQGAWHPENPYGTRYFVQSGNGWNAPFTRIDGIVTAARCFHFLYASDDLSIAGASTESGSLSSVHGSAHPSGHLYDAIYPGGMNGIIDWRKSAYPSDSPEQASKVFGKVASGEYRGLQKTYLCERGFIRDVTGSGGGKLIKARSYRGLESPCGLSNPRINGVYLYIYNITRSQGHAVDNNSNQYGWLYPVKSDVFNNPSMSTWEIGDELLFLGPNLPNTPLISEDWLVPIAQSGEISMLDVFGDPLDIVNTPQLAFGWPGGWIDTIPDDTSKNYVFKQQSIGSDDERLSYTDNQGAAWVGGVNPTINTTTNAHLNAHPVGRVGFYTYTAYAFQTKPANNVSVLNFHQGILPVWYSMETAKIRGNCLTESLIGQGATNSAAVLNGGWAALRMYSLTQIGVFDTNTTYKPIPTHEKVPLGTPNNGSIAVKVLPYQVSKNQEVSLNFAFSKLVHNGSSWGDNGKMPPVNGMSTYTDDNGEVVLYGTATLAIPIGFTKNRARPGYQRLGVDL